MLRNYVTIALRQFRRGGTHMAVNVLGLALGTAICLLLLLLVYTEWSYDRFHEQKDQIRRVVFRYVGPDDAVRYQAQMTPDFTPAFKDAFPSVELATRLVKNERDYREGDRTRRFDLAEVDPDFWRMFSFPVVAGDAATALVDPSTIAISTEVARATFGARAPAWGSVLGRILTIPVDTTELAFSVGAVFEPMPTNSSIEFEAAISFENYGRLRLGGNNWGGRTSTYARMADGSPGDLGEPGNEYVRTIAAGYMDALRGSDQLTENDADFTLVMQPLTDMHRNPGIYVPYEENPHDPLYSRILAAIGLLILLLACINFMTLSVGRSATRAREVGVRKALGAARSQVLRQHWSESVAMAAGSMLLGVGLALTLLPAFRTLAQSDLPLTGIPILGAAALFIALTILVGAISGGYPAFVLSRFLPASVLKGKVDAPRQGLVTRSLVVVQFTISIALIACTVVMTRQLGYMLNKDLGFDDDFVVAVESRQVPDVEAPNVLERMKNELLTNERIAYVERSGYTFTRGSDRNTWQDANGNTRSAFNYGVGYDYLDAMGMELADGRFFSEDFPADPTHSIVVNEALVREFGIEKPVGHVLTNWLSFIYDESPTIIGVVKDFNYRSLRNDVYPLVMNMHPDYYNWMGAILVKIRPGDVPGTLAFIEAKWNEIMPGKPFTYSFVDQDLAAQYESERRWQRILTTSSFLAVVIACMGLFGLALLAVSRRTKEIGIRKVLGASTPGLSAMLTREFVLLVLIAAVLAVPAAWYAMSAWLEGFAYRVSVGPWVFALATAIALAIAVSTVLIHAVRAALADPARSLRYE